MRIPEIITELFDSTTQWKLENDSVVPGRAGRRVRRYSWRIGNKTYNLYATTWKNEWVVSFTRQHPQCPYGSGTHDVTGEGDALQVFSTVIDIIMNDLIPIVDPDRVSFVAELYDDNDNITNRARLYDRLVKKYTPSNYTVDIERDDHEVEFIITKDDLDENT